MNRNEFESVVNDFKYRNIPFGVGFFGVLVRQIPGGKIKRRMRLQMLKMGLELVNRSGAIVYGDEWVFGDKK